MTCHPDVEMRVQVGLLVGPEPGGPSHLHLEALLTYTSPNAGAGLLVGPEPRLQEQ